MKLAATECPKIFFFPFFSVAIEVFDDFLACSQVSDRCPFGLLVEYILLLMLIVCLHIRVDAKSVNASGPQSKSGCKDQESIQSRTTPDPGYQWESDKLTVIHQTNESQEVSPSR